MTAAALRALPVAPVPAPAQAPKPAPQAKAPPAHPFAELLRQNRAASAAPKAQAAAGAPPQKDDDPATSSEAPAISEGTAAEPTPDSAAPSRDARQAKARGTDNSRAAASTATASAATTPDASADAAARATDNKNPAVSPPDASLIAGAVAGAAAGAAPSAKGEATDAEAAARGQGAAAIDPGRADPRAAQGTSLSPLDDGAQGAIGAASNGRALAANDKDDVASARSASDASDSPAAPALDAPATASFAGMLAESKTAHATGLASHASDATATAALPGSGMFAGTAPSATAVAAATLPVPVHAPEFAAAFGVQVSVLAKDGVQRAELHLNPAEMGPVSIQITLDGTQARVDFGADAAATRHAIEAGLPELASALRDAGFTLAGGGVAQHSASNGGGNAGDAEAGRAASSRAGAARDGEPGAAATRLTRRVADGGVDLYA